VLLPGACDAAAAAAAASLAQWDALQAAFHIAAMSFKLCLLSAQED
jgi:hypothetical protein